MEEIIRKSIEGGWNGKILRFHNEDNSQSVNVYSHIVCDPLFFQALGKACASNKAGSVWLLKSDWLNHALRFHEINLTEGWNAAISYLQTLVNKHG